MIHLCLRVTKRTRFLWFVTVSCDLWDFYSIGKRHNLNNSASAWISISNQETPLQKLSECLNLFSIGNRTGTRWFYLFLKLKQSDSSWGSWEFRTSVYQQNVQGTNTETNWESKLTLQGPCIIFAIYIHSNEIHNAVALIKFLLVLRCQLYMFRTVTVHPQELLFR